MQNWPVPLACRAPDGLDWEPMVPWALATEMPASNAATAVSVVIVFIVSPPSVDAAWRHAKPTGVTQ
jgi:hypothetical protein